MTKWNAFAAAGVVIALMAIGLASARSQPDGEPPQRMATGIVFHDANGNQRRDAGEQPLPDVRVSNGHAIVKTDAEGRYRVPVGEDTAIFVIKPRGWRTPLSREMLPRFYYLHKPHGSPKDYKFAGVAPTGPLPESIDFPLMPQDEPDQFTAILLGDPQPRNQQEVDWITHDIVEELIGTDASFGVTLGDIAFDNLDTMEPLNRAIALIGIPWYNVIGNHDINYDSHTRKDANETYERIYGPSYYSFDYGPVHFIVVDDIEWLFDEETGKGRYVGGLGPEQVAFLKTDLSLIPEDQLVVLMMHIPLTDVHDRHGLYRLIEQRPFCISISAHLHAHQHRFITREDGWMGPEPHHHIVNVTGCGSWWSGVPDERGIPHAMMSDGGPNGYSIISFDGEKYDLTFKAAGRPADFQMQIHAPEVVASANAAAAEVFVNVFAGSERSTVDMRLGDGPWTAMTRTIAPDPTFVQVKAFEDAPLEANKAWRSLPRPGDSQHLWKAHLPANPPPGAHALLVRTTDMFGKTYMDQRVIRVE